jgi:MFS family permease
MDISAINWLAVIAAVLVGFPIGFLWYGPLFGKQWMASVGLDEEKIEENSNMVKVFGVTLVFEFIMATCLALFFFGDPATADMITASSGAFYGFLTGFGWVAMAIGVSAMFEQRSFTYVAIVGGYWVVIFTLMGLILGAWR